MQGQSRTSLAVPTQSKQFARIALSGEIGFSLMSCSEDDEEEEGDSEDRYHPDDVTKQVTHHSITLISGLTKVIG